MNSLLNNTKFEVIGPLVAAGQADTPSVTRVDMAGYDGCLFICTCTVFAANGVATFSIEGSATDADPGAGAKLTGAEVAITDGGGGTTTGLLIIDVYQPQLRYLAGTRISSVANVTFGPLIAIKYNGKTGPVTQGAAVLNSTTVMGV
jgi:hypothetical protein